MLTGIIRCLWIKEGGIPLPARIKPDCRPSDRHHLPRDEFAAGLKRVFYSGFNAAAAWYFHADNGDIFNIVKADDFCQFFGIVRHIQLWTPNQGDASRDEVIVEAAIGKSSAVSCYEQPGILKVRRLYRNQLNLDRPLGQPAFHGGDGGCLVIRRGLGIGQGSGNGPGQGTWTSAGRGLSALLFCFT